MDCSGGDRKALIAYVSWNRLVPWKILSLPDEEGGALVPVGYGSNQKTLRKNGGTGADIWVVTLPWVKNKETGKLRAYPFVSLVARLESAGVYKCMCGVPAHLRSEGMRALLEDWGWAAAAARNIDTCRFYGMNDVTRALVNLKILEPADVADSSEARKRVGSRLQAIRVPKETADTVEAEFDECLSKGQSRAPAVLISFKSEDNYEYALELAEALLGEGYSPWLDSLTIPLYKSTEGDPEAEMRLRRLIDEGVRNTDLAIALVSQGYARGVDQPDWTGYEQDLICREKRQGRPAFRALGLLDGVGEDEVLTEAFHHRARKASVAATTRLIVEWFESQESGHDVVDQPLEGKWPKAFGTTTSSS